MNHRLGRECLDRVQRVRQEDFDCSFVRRSLRPVPVPPWRALVDRAADVLLVVIAVVLLVGGFVLRGCG